MTLNLGVFSSLSPQRAAQLAAAHVAHAALVNDGLNPADLRTAAKRHLDDNPLHWTLRKYQVLHPASFLSVANDWLQTPELPWSGKHRDAVEGRIRKHALPAIGHKTMGLPTLNDITGHGSGAVGRALTAQAFKWDSALAELQLDHTVKGANGRAHHRTHMLGQRREMMQEWADCLDPLRAGEITGNAPLHGLTPITRKAESPSPPAAQIAVAPVRPIDFEDSRNRISNETKKRQACFSAPVLPVFNDKTGVVRSRHAARSKTSTRAQKENPMRQTIAGDKLTLHRYDGVDDERKSKMARIGSLPLGTKPDAIPEALVDDLTPRELRELKEFLAQEQGRRATQKLGDLVPALDDLLACAAAGMLGPGQVADLEKTTSDFLKRLRRMGASRMSATEVISVT